MHPEDLSSHPPPLTKVAYSHQFAQDLLSLKFKVKTPQMSPGSQAHQDVASPSCIPSPAVSGTPLPRGMKSFLQNGLHVGQSPRTGSPPSAFFSVVTLLQPQHEEQPQALPQFPTPVLHRMDHTKNLVVLPAASRRGDSGQSYALTKPPFQKIQRIPAPYHTPFPLGCSMP